VEVARAASRTGLPAADSAGVKKWFASYTNWMNTHPYGISERDALNNHGTCWVTQVAAFAELTGDTKLTSYCRDRFMTVLIPNQEAADGSFPQELKAHETVWLFAFQSGCDGDHRADSWVVEVADAGWVRDGEGHGVHVSVHAG